jgi:hypothetical protein
MALRKKEETAKKAETKASEGKKEDLTKATKKTTEEKAEEMVQMSMADLQKFIAEKVDEAISIQSLKTPPSPDEFDKDDYLEQPTLFFCFKDKYSIYCDTKRHGNTPPPNGPVKFAALYRYKKKFAKGEKAITISQYASYSKKEIEWLKQHENFDVMFFESIDATYGKNAMLADKMATIATTVNSMSDIDVINRCKSEGIAISSDNPSKLRKILIGKMAERELEADRSRKTAAHIKSLERVEKTINPAEVESASNVY